MKLLMRFGLVSAAITTAFALAVPVIARVIQPISDYGFDVFNASEWSLDANEHQARMIFLWEKTGAVIRIDYAQLQDQTQIDDFEPALTQGVRAFEQCQRGLTSLSDISFLAGEGRRYHTRLWIRRIAPDHVLRVIATFAPNFDMQMDYYAERLFPDLPSCAALGIT